MADNDELVKKAKTGDALAFEKLIEECQQTVYNIAYRMSGNADEASDMAQEIFIKIYRNIKKFDGKSKFSTWVYRVATNTCLDEIKKRKRNITYSVDSEIDTKEGSVVKEYEDTSPTPEEIIETKEIRETVNKAILKLPKHHSEVIILRDINNFSYEEIANILKCSVGTVKSRLSRARLALKAILKKDEELFKKYFV